MEAKKRRFPLPEIFLILSNAIPLAGALFLNWNLLSIFMVYWAESGVVGIYNIFRMIKAPGFGKAFMVPFFMFHYGIFMMVHYMFILVFGAFAGYGFVIEEGSLSPLYADPTLLSAIAASFVSHGVSYFQNFIGRGEYLKTTAIHQMIRPYGRIVVMHVAILASAFAMAFAGFERPVVAAVILIILKTALDFISHRKERKKAEAS